MIMQPEKYIIHQLYEKDKLIPTNTLLMLQYPLNSEAAADIKKKPVPIIISPIIILNKDVEILYLLTFYWPNIMRY